ncbi:MAG: LLM class flavin-dependent oxidoreductase [Acidimicrobiia bacterium]|nr:LLM class flavin-dependent oxidoreductase [Acidimicrobiia bacterium]
MSGHGRIPWGVWFEPTQPVTRLVALAGLAEGLGAEVCLVADEGTERDVYVALTAILAATDALVVGPAITNPFSRHPVTTAAAVATLDEMAPGRVWHGLGVGGSRVLAPLQLEPERPYSALVDTFVANRRLLSGRRAGPASLDWFHGDVPMAVAGRGPRVQRFAAAEADWVILSAKALAELPEAAAAIRGGGARVAWSAYLAYSGTERCRALRHFAYMALDAPADIRQQVGLDELRAARVRRAMLAGHLDEAAEHLPESLLDLYAVTGTPTECAARIAGLRDSFDLFVLPMNDEETCEEHIEAAAAILGAAADLTATTD